MPETCACIYSIQIFSKVNMVKRYQVYWVESACAPCVTVGSLQVLRLPSHGPKMYVLGE